MSSTGPASPTEVLARRLLLPAGECAALCAQLGLLLPPGFAAAPTAVQRADLLVDGAVHPSLAAGLSVTCSPHVGVLLTSTAHQLVAAFGVRGDLGGSLLRVGSSDVEVRAWPAVRLGAELERAVPALGDSPQAPRRLALDELADDADLRAHVIGRLRATVVAPPAVVGEVTWLASRTGWLSLEPAGAHEVRRWVSLAPIARADLSGALAPLVAAALA